MEQRVERLQKITAFITAATALILGVIFYNGAGEQGWLVLLSLAAVFLYLQTIVVRIGERADYSLATASVLPIVFLCGPTPAMIVSALAGIADGVVHKKEWQMCIRDRASALTNRPVRADVSMTGEITLRGRVLAVGGIKEKLLAAHRAGISRVLLPAENEKDLEEVPANVPVSYTHLTPFRLPCGTGWK